MSRDDILDTQALRDEADGDPHIERQLLLLYITTAERCLALIQALVVHENRTEWVAATRELRLASLKIHAGQLLRLPRPATPLTTPPRGCAFTWKSRTPSSNSSAICGATICWSARRAIPERRNVRFLCRSYPSSG